METNGHAWEQAYDLVDTDNGVAQFPNYWVDTQGIRFLRRRRSTPQATPE